MSKELNLELLSSPDYHRSIGIVPNWRIGKTKGDIKPIFPFYNADQCEKILDNVLGIDGWGCEYREVAGILFCTIQLITGNGIIEKSDAGGARDSTYIDGENEKENYENMTAASRSFVRACAKVGISRYLNDLPKVKMKVSGTVVIAPDGTRLETPERLTDYCNRMHPSLMYLGAAYNMCKATFEANDRAKAMFTELREIIETATR